VHHHSIDEHQLAIVSHQKNHACEIENLFCKDEKASTCGHEHHLNNPIAKCFFSQFHFEKNYASSSIIFCAVFSQQLEKYFTSNTQAAISFSKLKSNKGPPVKV